MVKQVEVATVGYQGATVHSFLQALREAGIELLVDVRAVASSRRPGFAKSALAANLEFVYRHELPNSSWTMLAGGGPAANFYSFDNPFGDDSDFGGGLNLLLGIEHSRGIFAEVKVGLIDSPGIKFGVGINLGR